MSNLKGKTVIITGASRGIGQAIALRYATANANVVTLKTSLSKKNFVVLQKASQSHWNDHVLHM